MAKTASDFPKAMAYFGINTDDDDQIDAVNDVLKNADYRGDMAAVERELGMNRVPSGYLQGVVRAALGAALAARGVRPEEVRR